MNTIKQMDWEASHNWSYFSRLKLQEERFQVNIRRKYITAGAWMAPQWNPWSRVRWPPRCSSTVAPNVPHYWLCCLPSLDVFKKRLCAIYQRCLCSTFLASNVGWDLKKTITCLFLDTIQSPVMTLKALKDMSSNSLKDHSFPYEPTQGWWSSGKVFLSVLPQGHLVR